MGLGEASGTDVLRAFRVTGSAAGVAGVDSGDGVGVGVDSGVGELSGVGVGVASGTGELTGVGSGLGEG